MNIKFDESKPIYLQIGEGIKKAIARGDLKMGEKVPSVRELALKLKVNPNTVQHAYQELIREGIIFTKRGQGNFVSEDPERIKALREQLITEIVDNFVREINEVGFSISSREILKLLEEKNDRS